MRRCLSPRITASSPKGLFAPGGRLTGRPIGPGGRQIRRTLRSVDSAGRGAKTSSNPNPHIVAGRRFDRVEKRCVDDPVRPGRQRPHGRSGPVGGSQVEGVTVAPRVFAIRLHPRRARRRDPALGGGQAGQRHVSRAARNVGAARHLDETRRLCAQRLGHLGHHRRGRPHARAVHGVGAKWWHNRRGKQDQPERHERTAPAQDSAGAPVPGFFVWWLVSLTCRPPGPIGRPVKRPPGRTSSWANSP